MRRTPSYAEFSDITVEFNEQKGGRVEARPKVK